MNHAECTPESVVNPSILAEFSMNMPVSRSLVNPANRADQGDGRDKRAVSDASKQQAQGVDAYSRTKDIEYS